MSKLLPSLAGKSASFASFVYTSTSGRTKPETAKFRLILGAKTENLYAQDIAILNDLLTQEPKVTGIHRDAALAILASRQESLDKGVGNNSAYTNADTYDTIPGMPGVRVHRETGDLYVSGLQQSKRVIVAGEYKAVKSAPLTIAKREVEKALPSSRFRLFKLSPAALHEARVRGNVLRLSAAPVE